MYYGLSKKTSNQLIAIMSNPIDNASAGTTNGDDGVGNDMDMDMNGRFIGLEKDVSHINKDISDIKSDLRDIKNREIILILAAVAALTFVYFLIEGKINDLDKKFTSQNQVIINELGGLKNSIDKAIKQEIIQQEKK